MDWRWIIITVNVNNAIWNSRRGAASIIYKCWEGYTLCILFLSILVPFYKQSTIKGNTLVYKRIDNHNVPEYISTALIRNCDLHHRETRHSRINLISPKYKRETGGGHSFIIRTVKEWNSLKIDIRNQESIPSFKKKFYAHFLAQQKATMLLWGVIRSSDIVYIICKFKLLLLAFKFIFVYS